MTATEEQRPDLASLRIQREEEHERSGVPVVRIIAWLIALIALAPDGSPGAACTAGTGFDYAVARDGEIELLRAAEI